MIKYTRHNQVDKLKWDQCLEHSDQPIIYARYDYLECMCPQWEALVLNDYEVVMPITWNRKFGIHYLLQPFFCASLGIIGKGVNEEMVKEFLDHIPTRFVYWDIYLNKNNFFHPLGYSFNKRVNMVLDLQHDYSTLSKSFSKNHQKNISLALKSKMVIQRGIALEKIITLAKQQAKSYSPIKGIHYKRFERLYNIMQEENNAEAYGVFNKDNELLASAVFFYSYGSYYYILVGNNPRGRNSGASHYLINQFIKDHCNEPSILDFEGSNIESIARFYRGFGAKQEFYPSVKVNRLPRILKIFRQ